jgi:SPP1 family phage portal protein
MESNKIIWNKSTDPTPAEIVQLVKAYLASPQYQYLDYIGKYYNSQNANLFRQWQAKKDKHKMPNWCIPTAYYSTLVDSMSGYMFSNVVYSDDTEIEESEDGEEQEDSEFSVILNDTFKKLNIDTVDIKTGIRALAFNKGCEIVYTTGDKINKPEIHVVSVDPRQMMFIYNNDIEPKVLYGVRIVAIDEEIGGRKFKYVVDFISKDTWISYKISDTDEIIVNPDFEPRTLYWSECPCIEYNTETLNDNTAFHQVIPLIDGLDAVITGNANELDKLAEAILIISSQLTDEQKKTLNDMKLIEGATKDDVNQFLQRQIDPEFRRYLSDLLIREIHKHSHVIDFYSPDNGAQGDASGKALKVRMVDMNMFCDRVEKSVKLGWQKRIALFKEFFNKAMSMSNDEQYVDIVFNRTRIVGVEDIAPLLSTVTFMSETSKQKYSGLDPKEEKKNFEKEKLNNGTDVTDLLGDNVDNENDKVVNASAPMSEPQKADIK